MYKINLYSVGKNKESWLSEALQIYQKRLLSQIDIQFHWLKTTELLIKTLEKESFIVCFDPKGSELTSEQFAETLKQELQKSGCKLSIVIGPAEGLPNVLKKFPLISFSKMIFTHQLSRIIALEQIYRAVQIWKNSPYHFS